MSEAAPPSSASAPAPPPEADSVVDCALSSAVSAACTRHADWPSAGITFVDVLPLFRAPALRASAVAALASACRARLGGVAAVAGFDARGFLLVGVADALVVPFLPLRKAGKLPGACQREPYALEYGSATIEAQESAAAALPRGARVLLVDDLLATGGTAAAGARLLARMGLQPVALAVVCELAALGGAARVGLPVLCLFREGA